MSTSEQNNKPNTSPAARAELFFKCFDKSLDLEKEVPGLQLVAIDGDICFVFVPAELNSGSGFIPSAASMAALERLAKEGKVSDEGTDPTVEESKAVRKKATQSDRYRTLMSGWLSGPSDLTK